MISAQGAIASMNIKVAHHLSQLGLLCHALQANEDLVGSARRLVSCVAPDVALGLRWAILNKVDFQALWFLSVFEIFRASLNRAARSVTDFRGTLFRHYLMVFSFFRSHSGPSRYFIGCIVRTRAWAMMEVFGRGGRLLLSLKITFEGHLRRIKPLRGPLGIELFYFNRRQWPWLWCLERNSTAVIRFHCFFDHEALQGSMLVIGLAIRDLSRYIAGLLDLCASELVHQSLCRKLDDVLDVLHAFLGVAIENVYSSLFLCSLLHVRIGAMCNGLAHGLGLVEKRAKSCFAFLFNQGEEHLLQPITGILALGLVFNLCDDRLLIA